MISATHPVVFQVFATKLTEAGQPGVWLSIGEHAYGEIKRIERQRSNYPKSALQTRWCVVLVVKKEKKRAQTVLRPLTKAELAEALA